MVATGSTAQDPLVFFVEGVHGLPGECDPLPKVSCVGGRVDVLPRRTRRVLLVLGSVPSREPEVRVPGRVLGVFRTSGEMSVFGK